MANELKRPIWFPWKFIITCKINFILLKVFKNWYFYLFSTEFSKMNRSNLNMYLTIQWMVNDILNEEGIRCPSLKRFTREKVSLLTATVQFLFYLFTFITHIFQTGPKSYLSPAGKHGLGKMFVVKYQETGWRCRWAWEWYMF